MKQDMKTKGLTTKLLLPLLFLHVSTLQLIAQDEIWKSYDMYEIKDGKIEKCVNDLMYQAEEYIRDGGDDGFAFMENLNREDVKYGLSISNIDKAFYNITLRVSNDLNYDRWEEEAPSVYDGIVYLGENVLFYAHDENLTDITVRTDNCSQVSYSHPAIMGVEIHALYNYKRDLIVSKTIRCEGVTYYGKKDSVIHTNKAESITKPQQMKIPFVEITDKGLEKTIADIVQQMNESRKAYNEDNTILYLNIDNNYKNYIDIHLTAYYRSLESMANLNPDGVIILGQDTIFYEGRFMPDVMKTSDNKAYFSFNPESISRKGKSSKENEYDRYLMGFKIRYNPNRDIIYQKAQYFGEWYYTNGASE